MFERHVARHGPVPHRGPLAKSLRHRLYAAPRRLAHAGCCPASRSPCGISSARPWASRSTSCSAARSHEAAAAATPIYPEGDETAAIYHDAELSAQRAAQYVKQGFTAVKFDPAAPIPVFDPRQPSLRSIALCEKFVRLIREAVGTKADLPVRHPRPVHAPPAPSASPSVSSPTTPCGSRSRRRRRCRKRWRWWRAPLRYPSRPASVSPPSTSSPARVELRAASILQMALGRVGGLLEAKKIAGMAEAHYAQIARTSIAARSRSAANVQLAACSPNFPHPRSIQTCGRLPRQDPEEADALGGGLRHPVVRTWPRHRARRGRRPRPSLRRARKCISK